MSMNLFAVIPLSVALHQAPAQNFKVYVVHVRSQMALLSAVSPEIALQRAKLSWGDWDGNPEPADANIRPAQVGESWYTASTYPDGWKSKAFTDLAISKVLANQVKYKRSVWKAPYAEAFVPNPKARDYQQVYVPVVFEGEELWPIYRHEIEAFAVAVSAKSQEEARKKVDGDLIQGTIYKFGRSLTWEEANLKAASGQLPSYGWAGLMSNVVEPRAFVFSRTMWPHRAETVAKRPQVSPATPTTMTVQDYFGNIFSYGKSGDWIRGRDVGGGLFVVTARPKSDNSQEKSVVTPEGATVIRN